MHSGAFRRLQAKTQVFGTGEYDFYRTRLTHSLEVAQIGRGLAWKVGANRDLVEAVCLAHDMGHPPFGHRGEKALGELMKTFGGFEANAQTLRILCHLGSRFSPPHEGMNLTRATIDGVLKYKSPYPGIDKDKKRKFVYKEDEPILEWACKGNDKKELSLECQIMDWADNIAYSVHDLEDLLDAGILKPEAFTKNVDKEVVRAEIQEWANSEPTLGGKWETLFESQWKWLKNRIEKATGDTEKAKERKATIKALTSDLIGTFVESTTRKPRDKGESIRYKYKLHKPPQIAMANRILCVIELLHFGQDNRIRTLEYKGEQMIARLFEVFSNPDRETRFLYPVDFQERWKEADGDKSRTARIACDYIAGMTDSFAIRIYSRLFEPKAGSFTELV